MNWRRRAFGIASSFGGVAFGEPKLPRLLSSIAAGSGLMPAGNGAAIFHGSFADVLPYQQAEVT